MKKPVQEISSVSILEFLLATLKEGEPKNYIEVDEMVFNHFKNEWSKADLAMMKGNRQRKWQNSIDWAKANGTKKGLLATFKKGKARYLIKLPWWLPYLRHFKASSFKKKCAACGAYSPMSEHICKCGTEFPLPNARRLV